MKIESLGNGWDKTLVNFIYNEITEVIAPQKISNQATYIRARRPKGSKSKASQKKELWQIYEICWQFLLKISIPFDLSSHLAITQGVKEDINTALVVDEVQDLNACDLAFLERELLVLINSHFLRITNSVYMAEVIL